jgi:pyruvate formate lyase activating enzyme
MATKIKCSLCPKYCVLKDGQRGDCLVRENKKGKLRSLVYGKVCAMHIDPIEKKPLYHFLPATGVLSIATAGCNLHCLNCQNWEISQNPPEKVRSRDYSPKEIIKLAKKNKSKSIAYTYSEPIIFYEYMYDICKLARQNNIKNVMITAGYINEKPMRKLCKYIDGVNVDLKAFNNNFYKKVCDGTLAPVLKTLEICREEKVWLEITHLIVPTLNDNFKEIKKMCRWLKKNLGEDSVIHFSRFSPMYKLKNLPPTPAETLVKARNIALEVGLKYVYIGNVRVNKGGNTYCPNDKKLLVGRRGYFIYKNNMKDGKCKFCGTKIPGVWK